MSKSKYVEFRGDGFWAYDESLSILLALVVRVAGARVRSDPGDWMASHLHDWRVVAACADLGLTINSALTPEQVADLAEVVATVRAELATMPTLPVAEVESWRVLAEQGALLRPLPRSVIDTEPIIALASAILGLLSDDPARRPKSGWYYGFQNAPVPPPTQERGGSG